MMLQAKGMKMDQTLWLLNLLEADLSDYKYLMLALEQFQVQKQLSASQSSASESNVSTEVAVEKKIVAVVLTHLDRLRTQSSDFIIQSEDYEKLLDLATCMTSLTPRSSFILFTLLVDTVQDDGGKLDGVAIELLSNFKYGKSETRLLFQHIVKSDPLNYIPRYIEPHDLVSDYPTSFLVSDDALACE